MYGYNRKSIKPFNKTQDYWGSIGGNPHQTRLDVP